MVSQDPSRIEMRSYTCGFRCGPNQQQRVLELSNSLTLY